MSSSPLAKPTGAPTPRLSPEMELALSQPAIEANRAFCIAGPAGPLRLVFVEQLDDRKFFPRAAVMLDRASALQLAELIMKTVKS
jgi:hypothetical protein